MFVGTDELAAACRAVGPPPRHHVPALKGAFEPSLTRSSTDQGHVPPAGECGDFSIIVSLEKPLGRVSGLPGSNPRPRERSPGFESRPFRFVEPDLAHLRRSRSVPRWSCLRQDAGGYLVRT